MSMPSRVMGAGNSPLSTGAICGGSSGLITATGSTAADAFLITGTVAQVGTTSSGTGIKLLPCENGGHIMVANDGLQTLTVYPQTTSPATTIDGASSVTIATNKRRIFRGTSTTTWISLLGV